MSILCFRPSSLVALMATYRLYARRTRERHSLEAAKSFVCATDLEAIAEAEGRADGHQVEVWDSDRLVTRITSPPRQ
jgi:hypothetical protein